LGSVRFQSLIKIAASASVGPTLLLYELRNCLWTVALGGAVVKSNQQIL